MEVRPWLSIVRDIPSAPRKAAVSRCWRQNGPSSFCPIRRRWKTLTITREAASGDENSFSFFLHAYEERLNRRIRGFLLREGFRNTEPDRLFDYKLACVRAMLEVLPGYDPQRRRELSDLWRIMTLKTP